MCWLWIGEHGHSWREKETPTDGAWAPRLYVRCVLLCYLTGSPSFPGLPRTHHGGQKIFWTGRGRLGVLWPLRLHGLGCCSSKVIETSALQAADKGAFLSILLFRKGPELLCLWMHTAHLVAYDQWAGWGWGVGAKSCIKDLAHWLPPEEEKI